MSALLGILLGVISLLFGWSIAYLAADKWPKRKYLRIAIVGWYWVFAIVVGVTILQKV